jgi:hypothetical protein
MRRIPASRFPFRQWMMSTIRISTERRVMKGRLQSPDGYTIVFPACALAGPVRSMLSAPMEGDQLINSGSALSDCCGSMKLFSPFGADDCTTGRYERRALDCPSLAAAARSAYRALEAVQGQRPTPLANTIANRAGEVVLVLGMNLRAGEHLL